MSPYLLVEKIPTIEKWLGDIMLSPEPSPFHPSEIALFSCCQHMLFSGENPCSCQISVTTVILWWITQDVPNATFWNRKLTPEKNGFKTLYGQVMQHKRLISVQLVPLYSCCLVNLSIPMK